MAETKYLKRTIARHAALHLVADGSVQLVKNTYTSTWRLVTGGDDGPLGTRPADPVQELALNELLKSQLIQDSGHLGPNIFSPTMQKLTDLGIKTLARWHNDVLSGK